MSVWLISKSAASYAHTLAIKNLKKSILLHLCILSLDKSHVVT